ncbi:MAG: quinoprotein dehydrogenase-associated SoxYZ-like carrier [Arcobacter sp.]|nr:MAG: quinoprotein dehydrogenase-associated SoxYZ-like carrier [Arcobacter sp.]
MKYLFNLILAIIFIQNLYANNPVVSPTFDDIMKEIIQNQKYIFDDKNITIKVPKFADNPTQVPIFVDAKKIKSAKRMIIFADLNPIPKLVDMKLNDLLPIISLNMKVAQETPLRALVLDENNLWHVGSENIKSFGGGCAVSSVAASNTDFSKLLGKIKTSQYDKEDGSRLKASIFHPMETGLVFGNSEFFINKIIIKQEKKILGTIETYSAISENPRFIFETKDKSKKYSIEFYDNDGNEFIGNTK